MGPYRHGGRIRRLVLGGLGGGLGRLLLGRHGLFFRLLGLLLLFGGGGQEGFEVALGLGEEGVVTGQLGLGRLPGPGQLLHVGHGLGLGRPQSGLGRLGLRPVGVDGVDGIVQPVRGDPGVLLLVGLRRVVARVEQRERRVVVVTGHVVVEGELAENDGGPGLGPAVGVETGAHDGELRLDGDLVRLGLVIAGDQLLQQGAVLGDALSQLADLGLVRLGVGRRQGRSNRRRRCRRQADHGDEDDGPRHVEVRPAADEP
jgi:hypothetical protein